MYTPISIIYVFRRCFFYQKHLSLIFLAMHPYLLLLAPFISLCNAFPQLHTRQSSSANTTTTNATILALPTLLTQPAEPAEPVVPTSYGRIASCVLQDWTSTQKGLDARRWGRTRALSRRGMICCGMMWRLHMGFIVSGVRNHLRHSISFHDLPSHAQSNEPAVTDSADAEYSITKPLHLHLQRPLWRRGASPHPIRME